MKTTTQTQKTVVTCFAVFLLAMVPATVLAGSRGIVASGPVRPNPEERGIVTSGPVRPNPLAIVTSGPVRPLDFEGVIPYEPLSPAENGNDLLSVAPWAPLMPTDSPVASSYAVGSFVDELGVIPIVPLTPVGERGIVTSGPVIVPDLHQETLAALLDGVSLEDREAVADIASYLVDQMILGEESDSVLLLDWNADTMWFGFDECTADGRSDVAAYGLGVMHEANGQDLMQLDLLVETDTEMFWVQIQVSDSH